MTRKKIAQPVLWLISGLFSLLMMLIYVGFEHITYIPNDDVGMIRSMEGWLGVYPTFNLHSHSLLVMLVTGLSKAFPNLAVFSVLQLLCTWVVIMVMAKCGMQLAQKKGASVLWGLMLAAGLYMVMIGCNVRAFTIQGVWCLCAAVMQIVTLLGEKSPRKIVLGMIPALLLAAFTYIMRIQLLLSVLGCCGLAMLILLACVPKEADGKYSRPAFLTVLLAMAVCVASMGGLVLMRQMELKDETNAGLLRFNEARVVINDYHQDIDIVSDERLQELGWKRCYLPVIKDYNMMDHRFNAETFEGAIQSSKNMYTMPLRDKVYWTWIAIRNNIFKYPVALCLIPLVLCAAWVILRGRWMHKLLALLTVLCAAAQYVAVCWLGRPFHHVTAAAFAPPMLMAIALALQYLPGRKLAASAAGKIIPAVLMAASLAGCVLVTTGSNPIEFNPGQLFRQDGAQASCDQYALEHPDTLFLCDYIEDVRTFPDTAKGKPANLLHSVGWMSISKEYREVMNRFGIPWEQVDGTMYLRDNVRLMTRGDYNLEHLLPYIQSHFPDQTITYEVEAQLDGGMVLRFVASAK
ncbi:MAG: hypothetical protein Q4C54_09805 [Clostridia bacterium]|nr:hypothetical protein [Clostridia bacterium]